MPDQIMTKIGGKNCFLGYRFSRGVALPLVFFHGFGSTNEDIAEINHYMPLKNHGFLAFDAPGCGASRHPEPAALSVAAIEEAAEALLEHLNIRRFHLLGHSMGGLAALKFAARAPERVASFTSIEGNLSFEDDCFYSRKALEENYAGADEFFAKLQTEVLEGKAPGEAIYGAGLAAKVGPKAALAYLRSVAVETRDGDLLAKFLALPCPRHFIHGDANRGLSYLAKLRAEGVKVTEILHSGHFPMLTNPPALWRAIADFVTGLET